jgi:hypothetical protein
MARSKDSPRVRRIIVPNALFHLYGSYHTTCGYCGEQPGTRSPFQSAHSYGIETYPRQLQCSVRGAAIEAILNPKSVYNRSTWIWFTEDGEGMAPPDNDGACVGLNHPFEGLGGSFTSLI